MKIYCKRRINFREFSDPDLFEYIKGKDIWVLVKYHYSKTPDYFIQVQDNPNFSYPELVVNYVPYDDLENDRIILRRNYFPNLVFDARRIEVVRPVDIRASGDLFVYPETTEEG